MACKRSLLASSVILAPKSNGEGVVVLLGLSVFAVVNGGGSSFESKSALVDDGKWSLVLRLTGAGVEKNSTPFSRWLMIGKFIRKPEFESRTFLFQVFNFIFRNFFPSKQSMHCLFLKTLTLCFLRIFFFLLVIVVIVLVIIVIIVIIVVFFIVISCVFPEKKNR